MQRNCDLVKARIGDSMKSYLVYVIVSLVNYGCEKGNIPEMYVTSFS